MFGLLENWEVWGDRIYKYAKLESNCRVKVKSLIEEYESSVQLEESGDVLASCPEIAMLLGVT